MVLENIHTHTTGGISEFRRGGGVTSTGIPKGRGVTSTGIPTTWGVHWTGIPKAYGGFQESNFQFVVVKSLHEKLLNMRHVQLNQHAGDTIQWSWSIKCLC